MYKKLLRELNKGNAVLLEVVEKRHSFLPGRDWVSRYRLVTPSSCKYSFLFSDKFERFKVSCFMHQNGLVKITPYTPNYIVDAMKKYDKDDHYKIVKLQVI
jgi:hypothetical protein